MVKLLILLPTEQKIRRIRGEAFLAFREDLVASFSSVCVKEGQENLLKARNEPGERVQQSYSVIMWPGS